MKEVTKYICGTCGREYDDREKCLECESRHIIPKEIVDWEPDQYGILHRMISTPTRINVRMQNGAIETYVRADLAYGRRV